MNCILSHLPTFKSDRKQLRTERALRFISWRSRLRLFIS